MICAVVQVVEQRPGNKGVSFGLNFIPKQITIVEWRGKDGAS